MTALRYALTLRQPHADFVMAGVQTVANRPGSVLSTVPQWLRCSHCGERVSPGGRIVVARECDGSARHGGSILLDGPFPIRVGIHAGKRIDRDAIRRWVGEHRYMTATRLPGDDGHAGRLGVLLGFVTVTGCHHADECFATRNDMPGVTFVCSRGAEPGAWHWQLADPEPLDTPIPMPGRPGLWRLPNDLPASPAATVEA